MAIGDGVHSTNQARNDYVRDRVTVGFFTDPTVCIGCKACEVACKEWNGVPADPEAEWSGDSYDHTGALGASTWRHVKFLEQEQRLGAQIAGAMTGKSADGTSGEDPFRWLFVSDVCKHCEVAGCLEACPTGAIVRTETGGVFVQDDICNGCGYCVVACPFGVIDRRQDTRPAAGATDGWADGPAGKGEGGGSLSVPGAGGAFKCTFCYDRQKAGLTPACAKACPTESIQFGPLDELRERAKRRLGALQVLGYDDVSVYDPVDTSVKGVHGIFLIPGDPADLGLPTDPEAPTAYLARAWRGALATAVGLLVVVAALFAVL